jgi:hypothetical protein
VQRVDPFARPSRPGPPPVASEEPEIASEAEPTEDTAVAAEHPDAEAEQTGADPQIDPA